MWEVGDMGLPGVIEEIASRFSRGKNNSMEFPWGD